MNKSFFIGAVGAHQQQKNLNVTGNNIANVNTYGFKAEKGRFDNLLFQNLRAAGPAEQTEAGEEHGPKLGEVKVGTGAALKGTDTLFQYGGAAATGRMQDYMIEGDGFFALKDLATGEVSYTRSGAFSMASLQNNDGTQQWYLSDGCGRFVLDQQGEMIPMEMGDANKTMPVGVFDFANYNGIRHLDGTRFINVPKNGERTVGTGKVIQGALESSNVDLAQEITNMIETQRAYSMALKMMTTSDEIESTINSLRG